MITSIEKWCPYLINCQGENSPGCWELTGEQSTESAKGKHREQNCIGP
jgi:hypothetical protein